MAKNTNSLGTTPSRRHFLATVGVSSIAFSLPHATAGTMRTLSKPVKIGLIADLHHDIMHDGLNRMQTFINQMKKVEPDAIIQLGDFAYPGQKNRQVTDLFNQSHENSLHVIGNHDLDAGFTKNQCVDFWGMPNRYYVTTINGLHLIVLDGNDQGSPTHQGGYPSFIGKSQIAWLKKQLATLDGPIVVLSHQPLAGYGAVDNAQQLQAILSKHADKVVLAVNGHSHIDRLMRIENVNYLHLNSASYQWVGSNFKHESYSADIHDRHTTISRTCPYSNSLFATLTLNPETMDVQLEGSSARWVGPPPAKLGAEVDSGLIHGEDIAPRIRDRIIQRVSK